MSGGFYRAINHPSLQGMDEILRSLLESGLIDHLSKRYDFSRARSEREHYRRDEGQDWRSLRMNQVCGNLPFLGDKLNGNAIL